MNTITSKTINADELILNCIDGTYFTTSKLTEISSSLSELLPHLKIADYFITKPEVIMKSQYVVTASQTSGKIVAILTGNVIECSSRTFLNVGTLLIGGPYQGTRLFVSLWQTLFQTILQTYPHFVDALGIKTYNPISMSILLKVAKRSQATVYPKDALNVDQEIFMNTLIKVLGLKEKIDMKRGIIFGGAVGVPTDFYPYLPNIQNPSIKAMFASPLTSNDRLFGCLLMFSSVQKHALLQQFGILFSS